MTRRLLPLAPYAAHAVLVAALFADVLFGGRLPYFRDIPCQFYPNYVFTADALRQGLWPLWNPTADAGAPFFMPYPVELLQLRLFGAAATLAWDPPLHVWLAMCGATVLARVRGTTRSAAWLAGSAYGLSGFVLSSLNLLELAHAAAWTPWVLVALLRIADRPTARAVAGLGIVSALLISTMAGETMVSALLCGLFLFPYHRARATLPALGAAALLCLALAAPVLVGMRAFLQDTQRARGFSAAESLAWSVPPPVMAEAVLPRFFGDPHTFSDVGYWGQPFFPNGYPYLMSLYVGPLVVLLAWRGRRGQSRLWLLGALGLLLAAGAHGPLAAPLSVLMSHFRAPVKFMLMPTLALCLLAAHGVASEETRRPWTFWVVGGALLAAGTLVAWRADLPGIALGRVLPALGGPLAVDVVRRFWPLHLALAGLLTLGASLALAARPKIGARAGAWAAGFVVLDLVIVNGSINLSVPRAFYDLRPAVKDLVRAAGPGRWFSYGIANSPGIRWDPRVAAANSDRVLYALDRQTLWARAKTLDGLDGAFDEDRTAWAPAGATLHPAENAPALFARHYGRLRHAGVRWVLSFLPLPAGLATARGTAQLPEILEPLTLYEVRDALPRAFWVPDCEVASSPSAVRARLSDPGFDPAARVVLWEPPTHGAACGTGRAGGRGSVSWSRLDAHHVRLESAGDAGYIVFLEGHRRDWIADDGRPILRANDRYWAVPTSGGAQVIDVRFRPSWRPYALGASALGVGCALILLARRGLRLTQAPATC